MFYSLLSDLPIYIFALLAAAAGYSDVKRFIIPNSFSLSIAILYPAYVLTADIQPDWLFSLGIAATVLTLGFALFAFKICGGGDVKFFTAATLWAGPDLFVVFLSLTAVTGGVIAVSLWIGHRAAPMLPFLTQGLTSNFETFAKKPMPYGAAIALGAVYVAFTLLR